MYEVACFSCQRKRVLTLAPIASQDTGENFERRAWRSERASAAKIRSLSGFTSAPTGTPRPGVS